MSPKTVKKSSNVVTADIQYPTMNLPIYFSNPLSPMKTASQIMDLIRDDAPCVNHILHELHIDSPKALDDDDINDFYDRHPHTKPTDSQLLEILANYSWDNHDVYFWHGRYAQMLVDAKEQEKIIRVPFTESDADDIRAWASFLWNFWDRQLFLFNTDENPEWDEDSEEYIPDHELPI